MTPRTFHHQQGIALGPILFIIAILAIIAAAIAAGNGGFNANTTTEGGKVNASTIIQVGESLQNAVRKVVSQGCADTQISFANPVISGYTNPNSPSDNSCNVFDPNGGSMSFPVITASTLETADGGHFVFEGSNGVSGVGSCGIDGTSYATEHYCATNVPSLLAFLPINSLVTCNAINAQLGMSGYLGWDWYTNPSDPTSGHFTGGYNWNNGGMPDDGGTGKMGQLMGCLQQGSGGTSPSHNGTNYPYYAPYFFYVVLFIR